ncbi:hypothetical protein GIB67_025897 [Kingdonia uniflora]|uniref:Uncharacterized protein n=1 Tax=Kingdonia uniflora TaxID=39325 RepID=A0A7J7NZI8_9MAGN|nr:hypothetical protein GIB67_025897 [Kingdonia uniflora]
MICVGPVKFSRKLSLHITISSTIRGLIAVNLKLHLWFKNISLEELNFGTFGLELEGFGAVHLCVGFFRLVFPFNSFHLP